jgi:formylglycine-generating enzyme required for sulfatase activity
MVAADCLQNRGKTKDLFCALRNLLSFSTFVLLLLQPVSSPAAAVHREPLTAMDFLLVAGGTFPMGDTTGEGRATERPAHQVAVADFFLGRHEVTVAQFRTFVEETGYVTDAERAGGVIDIDPTMNAWVKREGISWKLPGFAQEDRSPVVWVSWNDASAFTGWMAEETGQPYRLPTEAEWEFAARDGGKPARWAGTSAVEELDEYAWFAANSSGQPHPVGNKRPNGLGLFDMSGNVWEWCLDWQVPYRASGTTLVDPVGPSLGEYRVLRGGSWRVEMGIIRTTYRNGYRPEYTHSSIGFRVALPRSPSTKVP